MKTLLFIAKIICAQFLLSLFIVSCDKETETPENPPESPHFDETKLRLNVSDSLAMVNIYKAMGPWSVEWDLTDRHTWNGVETMLDLDNNELRITGFESYGGRYKNTISEEFRKLTELRKLAIPGGTLSGNIPSWIGELTKLELLVLGDNYLNGEIPPEIGNLRQLQVLKITNCDIEGSIPETLGNLSNLVYLHLYGNKLSGEIHVYAQREVVEGETEEANEISLADAHEIDSRYEVGDIVETEVTPKNFGRIAAQNAKQVVVQRIREAERGMVYERFSSRENDIVTGVVQRIENKNVYIDLGKVEAVLAATEQIPGEVYQYHERMKTYIIEVKRTSKGPQIMVSRTHPGLLKRLFELEVPEIHDGVVEIKSVAREPGMRSKISVYTQDDNIDPVGACVGHKGMRVQTIVNELRGEKIDIVKYSEDPAQYVANALSPAKVVSTQVDENEKICRVVVPDYQLSLAIGKEGQNARLAAKLTGWKIDIKSESQAAAEADTEQVDYDQD